MTRLGSYGSGRLETTGEQRSRKAAQDRARVVLSMASYRQSAPLCDAWLSRAFPDARENAVSEKVNQLAHRYNVPAGLLRLGSRSCHVAKVRHELWFELYCDVDVELDVEDIAYRWGVNKKTVLLAVQRALENKQFEQQKARIGDT